VARFYQQPDLEGAYTVARSASDYCESIIFNVLKNGQMDYAESVDIQMLRAKAFSELNRLLAAKDDALYVNRLIALLTKIQKDVETIGTAMNPATRPPPSQPQDSSLNGIQIQSVIELCQSLSAQTLSGPSSLAILKLAFPDADPGVIQEIVNGTVGFNANVSNIKPQAMSNQGAA
jgi:hypothetical protein